MSRLDIIVFGATGYTGKNTVEELIKILDIKGASLTWGVAGRNASKIEKLLADIGETYERKLSDVPIIIADVSNEESLNAMAARARVVINCCGPYRFFGEPVVKACIANKTHHVDVTGEPQFMERMQLEYNEEAKKNGVYIVSACGFDSIPCDLGVIYLAKEFKGQVNSVETFLEAWNTGSEKSAAIHYGTWESAIYGLAHAKELVPLRRKLFPNKLPPMTPKLPARFPIHKNELIGKWCLPFPGADRSVVQRTQRWLFEVTKQRPIQVNTYVAMPNLFYTLMLVAFSTVFQLLVKFEFGRNLLLNYPRLFSFGSVSHEGPTDEHARNTHFSMTFFGEGWSETTAEPTDQHTTPPNKKIVTRVTGTNPGYGATCVTLIMSALTILKESDKMPNQGGIYTPAAAFGQTSLISEINSLGVKFEVLERGDSTGQLFKNRDSILTNWIFSKIGGVYTPGAAFYRTSLVEEISRLGVKFEVMSRSQ